MKAAILYDILFKPDGRELSIGGVQTYLLRLAELINDMGWETIIFQLAETDFENEVGKVKVWGRCGIPLESDARAIGSFLSGRAEKWIGDSEGIIIFGTDSLSVRTSRKSIAIQHGITEDIPRADDSGISGGILQALPERYHRSARRMISRLRGSRLNHLRRAWMSSKSEVIDRGQSASHMVCVDYNYMNVCRAQGRPPMGRVWVIPNSASFRARGETAPRRGEKGSVKILFARRFVWYRGTRLIAPVFKRILCVCPNASVTFAGEGPDEDWLREYFSDVDRVSFMKYSSEEAVNIMMSHDIAVIPSLGSEGTSLSALEAMSAGCVVVATWVGGLTNIIIDGYNGMLVAPLEEELFSAVYNMATDIELRRKMAQRALGTVKESFSTDRWREKWRRVLLHVSHVQ